jgi:hypothetical protein
MSKREKNNNNQEKTMTAMRKRIAIGPCNMDEIEAQVDLLFQGAPARRGESRRNPVTGGGYISGYDPIKPQKEAACRALRAREWFAVTAPHDAPPLPLSYGEREALKAGGLPHLVAWYARSLEARDYKYWEHPSFDDYARGVLASPYAPDFIKEDAQLRQRFSAKPLNGLGSGLYWSPLRPKSCKSSPLLRRQRDGVS